MRPTAGKLQTSTYQVCLAEEFTKSFVDGLKLQTADDVTYKVNSEGQDIMKIPDPSSREKLFSLDEAHMTDPFTPGVIRLGTFEGLIHGTSMGYDIRRSIHLTVFPIAYGSYSGDEDVKRMFVQGRTPSSTQGATQQITAADHKAWFERYCRAS